jgi:hypothetical protein
VKCGGPFGPRTADHISSSSSPLPSLISPERQTALPNFFFLLEPVGPLYILSHYIISYFNKIVKRQMNLPRFFPFYWKTNKHSREANNILNFGFWISLRRHFLKREEKFSVFIFYCYWTKNNFFYHLKFMSILLDNFAQKFFVFGACCWGRSVLKSFFIL